MSTESAQAHFDSLQQSLQECVKKYNDTRDEIAQCRAKLAALMESQITCSEKLFNTSQQIFAIEKQSLLAQIKKVDSE